MARIAVAERTVKMPDGVTVSVSDGVVSVKGPKGELRRTLTSPGVVVSVADQQVVIRAERPHRKEKALVGTFEAHIANMVKGVTTGFSYQMKTVYSHFPIKAKVEGDRFIIENFLGERHPRKAVILGDVKVQVKGDLVAVNGADKEHVGQTVANIERASKVTRRDVRVFQDGIYLVSKEAH